MAGLDGESEHLSGEMTAAGHRLVQRVYYEDTDFSGFVYHARYLHFMERGRTDFLRCLGIRQSDMAAKAGTGETAERLVFVVRHMDIAFRAPARMDDVLVIVTRPARLAGARLVLDQTVRAGGTVLIEARVEVAIVGDGCRPRRLPAAIAARLAGGGSGARRPPPAAHAAEGDDQ